MSSFTNATSSRRKNSWQQLVDQSAIQLDSTIDASVNTVSLQLNRNVSHSNHYYRCLAIVDLRTAANQAIFRIQGGVVRLFRRFLTSQGFMEVFVYLFGICCFCVFA
jgi:aspartyl/asparaginyl-tRNA synthetase